jgi:hypothetical protein
MGAVGGSPTECSIRGRVFAVAADADPQIKYGGLENEKRPNGDSTARTVKVRVSWSISGLVLSLDTSRDDHDFLQEVADNNDDVDITLTFANGTTVAGSGTITGEIAYSPQSTTASINCGGGGKLTRQ